MCAYANEKEGRQSGGGGGKSVEVYRAVCGRGKRKRERDGERERRV